MEPAYIKFLAVCVTMAVSPEILVLEPATFYKVRAVTAYRRNLLRFSQTPIQRNRICPPSGETVNYIFLQTSAVEKEL